MNPKTEATNAARAIQHGLADVALGDIKDVCAIVRMSPSWVHEETKAGRFPPPVIRQSRCTRWRLADVCAWIVKRIELAESETKPRERLTERAKKASAAARAPGAVAKARATRAANIAARDGRAVAA